MPGCWRRTEAEYSELPNSDFSTSVETRLPEEKWEGSNHLCFSDSELLPSLSPAFCLWGKQWVSKWWVSHSCWLFPKAIAKPCSFCPVQASWPRGRSPLTWGMTASCLKSQNSVISVASERNGLFPAHLKSHMNWESFHHFENCYRFCLVSKFFSAEHVKERGRIPISAYWDHTCSTWIHSPVPDVATSFWAKCKGSSKVLEEHIE